MADIHRLAFGAALIHIDQYQLGKRSCFHQRKGRGGSNETTSDDGGFTYINILLRQ